MPRQTRTEIEEALLRGRLVRWLDGSKQEAIHLKNPAQRRLFQFVLESQIRSVKCLSEAFVEGLATAFNGNDDPAILVGTSNSKPAVPGPWRLSRIEADGFGGVNVWAGPTFIYDFDGESLIIDGPNGSGKSSLVGALTWAMRGERIRDASVPSAVHDLSQVYDSNGSKIGEWPPLACYPHQAGQLATNPSVSVKLTFTNPNGQGASVERTLRNGRITTNENPALAFPPVLVETGLMMPARLSQIRLGSGDQQLTDAVQMLTGLEQIAALGDFIGDLCHKGRDFLNYARAHRRDDVQRQFDEALERGNKALAALGRNCVRFSPRDTRDPKGPMATLGQEVTRKASEAVGVVSEELLGSLDLKTATVQQQIAAAIEGAKTDVAEGLSGLAVWKTVTAIASALSGPASDQLESAITDARKRLEEAVHLHLKATDDPRFQLKALGAAWHEEHLSGEVEACPLCEQSLTDRPELAAEIGALRRAGAAARKAYEDNCNAIRTALQSAIPSPIRRYNDEVLSLNPKKDCETQLNKRFVQAPRYSACLIGIAQLMREALAEVPGDELPGLAPIEAGQFPNGTGGVLQTFAIAERLLAVTAWTATNQPLWTSWWDRLTVSPPGTEPAARLARKLLQLEEAIKAWTPYADASSALRDAWKQGLAIDKIDVEQDRRQKIADNLEPLKAMRKLAEAETRAAIEGLSTRMAKFLDDIYVSEKLKFHSTHFEKKAGVSIRGELNPGLRIDASLVANASWIRALLWAFVLAVREEAVEQLGEDRLPLLVLDDPQGTFDLTHRHRWIQRIAALQRGSPGLQVLLATHDESFSDQLSTLGMSGRRANLSAAGPDTESLHLAEGMSVVRAWTAAQAQNTPNAGRDYIAKVRVYVEAMMKVMLRGEEGTRTLTMGKLRDRIDTLHKKGVTPWNRPVFGDLVANLREPPEIKHLESSHHSTGSMLGMAEAMDVEKLWRKKLDPQMDKAFRQIREYRLLHGESKALFADPAVVPFPNGHRDIIRTMQLELVGRAAALTGGRVADGSVKLADLNAGEHEPVVLGDHDAFRLVTATLEPVARPGDILLVAAHGKVPPGSLVVATFSDRLLARRLQFSEEHPDVAVLVAQAITPSSIAPPFITHISTITLRRIVGVLFDHNGFPVSAPERSEVVDCGSDTAVKNLVKGSIGLVEVSGNSAEPQVLHGQFLLVGDEIAPDPACRNLDGRPVLATDSDGQQYFKRLRSVNGDTVFLESLHGGGEYPPVLLAMPGKGAHYLARVLPVLGVLFERK